MSSTIRSTEEKDVMKAKTGVRRSWMAVAAGLALAGCDGAGLSGVGDPVDPIEQPAVEGKGTRYELRMRGTDAGDIKAVLVGLESVKATAGDVSLPVELVARTIDLGEEQQSHLLGYVTVPEGVKKVAFTLQLEEFGGYEKGDTAGSLDLRGAPLRFESPVSELAKRGQAVVHVDLQKSLRSSRDGMRLMPTTITQY